MKFEFHSQKLGTEDLKTSIWMPNLFTETIPTNKIAICICDMWDEHWCLGATQRVAKLAIQMNKIIKIARAKGIQIIHAPSETLKYYKESPARQRLIIENKKEYAHWKKQLQAHKAPKFSLPIDDSDGGSDTGRFDLHKPNTQVWNRQISTIEIDESIDGISDDGTEIYAFLKKKGIEFYFIMGVHTNMCIINRTFGIRMMKAAGLKVALVRDLTDAMYNPAKKPYVSHEAGTALVCDFIEKFYCPSIKSSDFMS